MHKEVLENVVSKLFNFGSNEELAELLYEKSDDGEVKLKDSADTIIIDKMGEKMLKFKDKETQAFDNGYKKAQKEVLSKIEKEFETKYDFRSDKENLLEKFDDYFTHKLANTSKKGALTDDDIKKSPIYLALEAKYKDSTTKAEKLEQLEKEYNDYRTNGERKEKMKIVKDRALVELRKLNPMLPEDPEKASNWEKIFLNTFDSFDDFQIVENQITAIKDGKRYEDKIGNAINFGQLVKETADQYFTYMAQSAKGSAANKHNDNKNGGFKVPKTIEERNDMLAATNDFETMKKINDAWKASQG